MIKCYKPKKSCRNYSATKLMGNISIRACEQAKDILGKINNENTFDNLEVY